MYETEQEEKSIKEEDTIASTKSYQDLIEGYIKSDLNSDELSRIRNMGLAAHVDHGKTTTGERFLYFTGKDHKLTDIDRGDTTLDYLAQERERGITIVAANTTCEFNGYKINLIDTPGHMDFTAEVERSLSVLDGVIIVVCGSSGVQPQTETVNLQADRYHIPRLVYINKMDRLGANFYSVVDDICQKFSYKGIPIILPLGSEDKFRGHIDLIEEKVVVSTDNEGGTEIHEISFLSEEEKANYFFYRSILLETVKEFYPEAQLEKKEEFKKILRFLTINRKVIPVLCGSSKRSIGIQKLLESVIDFLPSPREREEVIKVKVSGEPEPISLKEVKRRFKDPFIAMVFKLVNDPYTGLLSFCRIYSGVIEKGDNVFNVRKATMEKASRVIEMHANEKIDLNASSTGNIVTLVGLKDTATGDTITSSSNNKFLMHGINFPTPVVNASLKIGNRKDYEELPKAASKLCKEDPTFFFRINKETGELIVEGMGKLHLEVMIDRLKTEYGITVVMENPRVSYRETIKGSAEKVYGEYIRMTGGHGHFAKVWINVKRRLSEEEPFFENKVVGVSEKRTITPELVSGVEEGVAEVLQTGILAGYPIVDVKVELVDAVIHDVDSAPIDFKIATMSAFKEGFIKANAILLEPIMRLEVHIPEDRTGNFLSYISSRRAKVTNTLPKGNFSVIESMVPLQSLFNFQSEFLSITEGRGFFDMRRESMNEVPADTAKEIIKNSPIHRR